MKILVIGGSGFIGSKLVPRLRQRGYEDRSGEADQKCNDSFFEAGVRAQTIVVIGHHQEDPCRPRFQDIY